MSIKLIASDMDGTFLDANGNYDREQFEKILTELQKQEIHFVAASGNNMTRLNRMFAGFEKDVTFVAENGAHIVENGQTIIHHSLPKLQVQALLTYFSDKLLDYRVVLSGIDGAYRLKNSNFDFRPGFGMIEEKEYEVFISHIKPVDDFSQIIEQEAISKVTMMVFDAHEAIAQDFNQNFQGDLVAVGSGYGAVDFIQKGIHKAWGIEQLMERYGIQADQVMTFGDGGNDIEMLQMTPHSYAVDNAPEAVKEAAQHEIGHHKDNAVMEIIEELLLKM